MLRRLRVRRGSIEGATFGGGLGFAIARRTKRPSPRGLRGFPAQKTFNRSGKRCRRLGQVGRSASPSLDGRMRPSPRGLRGFPA